MSAVVTLEGVSKRFGAITVARDLNLRIKHGQSVGLLGRNGAGKSTLLKLIAGTLPADQGRIVRHGRVSWPVGFAGSFHPDLTGRQNLRFVARLYGADVRALERFVSAFAGLGWQLDTPVRGYSSGMRARLGFGLSMAMPFELYLVDEVTAVGDAAFRASSEALLRERLKGAAALVVSHALQQLERLCTSGLVLENGRMHWHDNIRDAIAHHRANMGVTV